MTSSRVDKLTSSQVYKLIPKFCHSFAIDYGATYRTINLYASSRVHKFTSSQVHKLILMACCHSQSIIRDIMEPSTCIRVHKFTSSQVNTDGLLSFAIDYTRHYGTINWSTCQLVNLSTIYFNYSNAPILSISTS